MIEAYLLLANGKKHTLSKETVTVGRVAENDVAIDDQSISRGHARMTCVGTTWYVEDLGSKNKTFVSEKPIEPNKPVEIKDGATIHFGYVATKFHVKKDAAGSGDATLAVDMNDPGVAAMFEQASQKSAPMAPAASAPMGGMGGGVEEMRSNRRAFAYLELRSVTNPKKHPIEKESVLIGTSPAECDITLLDSTAAPVHAEIRFLKGQKIQLKNMSQDSGTQLAGRRIGKAFIKEGDQIDIGDSSFTFHFVEWPEISIKKESGSTTAAKFIIIVLVLMLLGGGGYAAYKMGYFQTPEEKKAIADLAAGTAKPGNIDEVLDAVTQGKYDEAQGLIMKLIAAPEMASQEPALRKMQAEISLIREAKEALATKDYVTAYRKSKELDYQNSQVANRASNDQREIIRRYREAIMRTKSDMEEAESAGNWELALKNATLLRGIESRLQEAVFEGSTDKLAAIQERVEMKRLLQNTYKAGLQDIDISYKQVIDDTTRVLGEVEEKTKSNPDLKNELTKYVANLQSLKANAELLKAYFEFDGVNLDDARRYRNSIGVDYERREDVNRRMAALEDIGRQYGEYLKLLTDFKEKKDPNLNPVRFYDMVIEKLEGILAREGDPRFELSKNSALDVARLREDKKKMLLEVFSSPIQGEFPTGMRGDLQRALAERQRWFEYLQLFSIDVRDNRYKPLILNELLKDDEIAKRFQEAYDRYDKARTEVLRMVLRNWQESSDLELKKDTINVIDRLQSLTLPEDKDTEKQIIGVRNQLR